MKNKTSLIGLLIAIAMIFSYIESLIPFYFGIYGLKLGLANIAIVLALYLYGFKEALLINILRIILVSILFGNIYSFMFSITGALLSLFIMTICYYTRKFSIVGVSIAGGIFHNVGQILFAVLFFKMRAFFYYIPILLVSGLLTGALIGVLLMDINKRIHFIQGEKR